MRAEARASLWVLIPVAVLGLLVVRPVGDVDIFWQLRFGELLLAQRSPVLPEPFAATHLGAPLVPLSALAQAGLAALRMVGGWGAVRLVDAAVWTGGFVAAGLAARRSGAGAIGIAIALTLCFALALPFAGIRPQSFAVLGLGLLILLLRQDWALPRSLVAGAVLLVVWQNLHPSVSIAAAYLAARAGTGWYGQWRGWRTNAPWRETALAAIAALAIVATPAGLAVLAVSLRNAQMSVAMGATEWLPLFDSANQPFLPLLLMLNGCVAVVAWLRRRDMDPEEAAGALVFALLALTAGRFVLFWAVALVPVLAGRSARTGARQNEASVRTGWPLALVLAGALVNAAASPAVTFAPDLPLTALTRLAAAGPAAPSRGTTIYASYPFGGAVVDAGQGWHVAFDGRYYRYDPEEWALCRAVMAGQIGPEELTRRYRPAAWVLSPGLDAPLIRALRDRPRHWRELYRDSAASVFVPAG